MPCGVDSVQAMELALKMIGAFIYGSDHHASGNLMWEAPGQGLRVSGSPTTFGICSIGDDKKYFG